MRRNISFISLVLLIMTVPLFSCTVPMNKVAVITLSGTIQSEQSASILSGSAITPDDVREYLCRADDDPMVKAIVIRIDSPGGDPAACQEIVYQMERTHKPIVISMRSMVTSGGYYISAGADRIVALPSTLTGSIGVITLIPDVEGLFDKVGVRMEVLKAGKYKDMYAGVRELTAEEKALIQKTTDQIYEQFIDVIVKGRNMERQNVLELADGQLFTGVDAKELGLVDELGDLQVAVDAAAKLAGVQSPELDFYEPEISNLLKKFLGMSNRTLPAAMNSGFLDAASITAMHILDNPYPIYLYK